MEKILINRLNEKVEKIDDNNHIVCVKNIDVIRETLNRLQVESDDKNIQNYIFEFNKKNILKMKMEQKKNKNKKIWKVLDIQ